MEIDNDIINKLVQVIKSQGWEIAQLEKELKQLTTRLKQCEKATGLELP